MLTGHPPSLFRLAAASLAALLVYGCQRREPLEHAGESVVLRAVLMPYISFAPMLLAQEAGAFQAQGLVVEWVRLVRSADALASLAGGQLDVAGGGISPGLVSLVARGTRVRLVASKGMVPESGCGGSWTLTARRGVASPPEGLRGATVAVDQTLFTQMFVDRTLEHYGLPDGAIRRVERPPQGSLEALAKGVFDYCLISDPELTRGRGRGVLGPVIETSAVLPPIDLSFVYFGPSLLERRPDLGTRFLMAYVQGVARYTEGKTEGNVRALARATGLEEDLVREICWPPIRPGAVVDRDSVAMTLEHALARGRIEPGVSVDDLVDPRPLIRAQEALLQAVPGPR